MTNSSHIGRRQPGLLQLIALHALPLRGRYRLATGLLALFLVACGGSSSGQNGGQSGQPPAGNTPPLISGTPADRATVGQAYSFTPTANDADGDTLTFSVTNRPAWAAFDAATGRISGTPDTAAVGTTAAIVISADDGTTTASLAPFSIEVLPANLDATLEWDPPITNSDGTPLTDLAGFRLYYGTSPGNYSQFVELGDASATSATISNLQPGFYYFAISALDRAGNESVYSTEVAELLAP